MNHSNKSLITPRRPFALLLVCAVALVVALPTLARASFHLMQIERVIGGVNGDTTAQAIQLRMRADNQNFLHSDSGGTQGPARLLAFDAAGGNPVTLLVFPTDVARGRKGDRVLVASANFSKYTSPLIQPDFIMTNLIPASYLAAGRLVYADGSGNVLWSFAYGGSAYTGSNTGLTLNDADGNFGPPFSGPLPSRFTVSTRFRGNDTDPSVSNATDYRLTDESAEVKNNRKDEARLPPLPGFFAGQVALDNDFYYLGFFGYINEDSFPFFFHTDLGFQYFFDAQNSERGAYLYDFGGLGFNYTSPSLYPYLYNFDANSFFYYFKDTTNPRVFYNFATGQFVFK